MRRLVRTRSSRRVRLAVALAVFLGLLPGAAPAGAQGEPQCLPDPDANRFELGQPDAAGVTQSAGLANPSDSVGFHFLVLQPQAALLYVGDQWYDLDLYLYGHRRCPKNSWDEIIRAWSVRSERRVIQFMRPDEQIVNLNPGDYLMLALYKPPADPSAAEPFDPRRNFTARVALSTPACGLDPPDELVPNPRNPSLTVPRRPDAALYQLGLSIDPTTEKERGPFALLTFNAFVSPPYTDLFDFTWTLDGQVQPDADGATLQIPASALNPNTVHRFR